MKTIESYLPVFPGFYGTYFDYDREEFDCEEEQVSYNLLEWDYEDYRKRVAEACISSVWNYFKLDRFTFDIEFEKVYSPRFYNFENDAIYCTYKVSDKDFAELIKYCKDNLSDFKTFLKEKYSSHSGFVSFFDIEPETWFNEYLNDDNDKFEKAFTGVLEFYLTNEGYTTEDMLDDVSSETSWYEYEINV